MDSREETKRRLMATFQQELKDHLSTVSKGLLALEDASDDDRASLLPELFRAAHSIKGASRAVGLRDVETIAHRMEDVFGALQQGSITSAPTLIDLLLKAMDALRDATEAQMRGEKLPRQRRNALLEGLQKALETQCADGEPAPAAPKPDAAPKPIAEQEAETPEVPRAPEPEAPMKASEEETPPPAPAPRTMPSSEETVRVATGKLDALVAGMGELLVTRMRFDQRLADLDELQKRLTRWQRTWRQVRTAYRSLQRHESSDPLVGELIEFLTTNEQNLDEVSNQMVEQVRSLAGDCSSLRLVFDDLQEGVHRTRMLPVANLFDRFPRLVRDLARERGKGVALRIEGPDVEMDRQVIESVSDPLMHLVRNAVDHGIEPADRREQAGKPRKGTVTLRAEQRGNTIVLEVIDDGAGIDVAAVRQKAVEQGLQSGSSAESLTQAEAIELIFKSGLSTQAEVTDVSGRGVGLDVVRQNLERLHGLIQVDTVPGRGTAFTLTLPLTVATCHVLLAEVANEKVAIPTTTVERILQVSEADVGEVAGKPAIRTSGRAVPLLPLAQVLELADNGGEVAADQKSLVVVIGAADRRISYRVDKLHGTQEVIIKSLGMQLSRVRNVAGATILGTGEVAMVLNAADLVKAGHLGVTPAAARPAAEAGGERRRRVLVVDDSITTRTLEKNILESAGYQVLTAADGQQAWALVQCEPLDAVVADINMPHLDGFELTETVKHDERYRELPLVLVTSLESSQDKIRGLEAGADAYITKGTFDQQELLETIERLIG